MSSNEIMGALETILFVYADPIAIDDLAKALILSAEEVEEAVDQLQKQYAARAAGIRIRRINDKVQLCSNEQYAPQVQRLLAPNQTKTLSNAVLETLSIIAYRQPITRAEIEEIRGVRCEYAVSQLAMNGLIAEVGKKDAVGRPSLFGTTEKFLQMFGLQTLDELPHLQEPEQQEAFPV